VIGTLAVDVTFGTGRRGLDGAAAYSHSTVTMAVSLTVNEIFSVKK